MLIMLLAAISHSAIAEWVDAGRNDDLAAYTDPSTIHISGNKVRMLSMTDHKTAITHSGRTYFSVKAQHEYDCSEKQARILFSSAHSGNMGTGKIVDSSYSHGDFEPVQPRSIMSTLWQAACGQR